MGRNANTCLERMMPLTISPSMARNSNPSITVWKTRMGEYFPFAKALYQFLFRI